MIRPKNLNPSLQSTGGITTFNDVLERQNANLTQFLFSGAPISTVAYPRLFFWSHTAKIAHWPHPICDEMMQSMVQQQQQPEAGSYFKASGCTLQTHVFSRTSFKIAEEYENFTLLQSVDRTYTSLIFWVVVRHGRGWRHPTFRIYSIVSRGYNIFFVISCGLQSKADYNKGRLTFFFFTLSKGQSVSQPFLG